MFLSVIMCVYNKEKYIHDALNSFLEQDYPKNDYEIVCVNDGSKDHSLEIINEYCCMYPNISVITKENGGLSAARNTGLRAAKGDYVWFADPDDFVSATSLSELKKAADKSHAERIRFGMHIFFQDTYPTRELFFSNVKEFNCEFSNWNVATSIFLRSFLLEHSLLFYEPIRAYGDDTLFMYEFKKVQNTSDEINQALYFYRNNSDSITGSTGDNSKLVKIASLTHIVKHIKYDYDHFDESFHFKKDYPAYMLTDILRMLMGTISGLKQRTKRKKCIKELKQANLFPFRTPVEYPKSNKEYISGVYGRSIIEKTLYCYSTTFIGYLLLSELYLPILRLKHNIINIIRLLLLKK